ncbi:hypothetical protein Krac_2383 [Ktedonobacter racemifer DSM 44963]|uniref:Uncharacterized protein n=1 Tax=Ktedonobacter racemifer DSM 44963 TaxID=485913 RepID=D6U567_KTERA|nr:hypothetical protein Krac_2383 [Ktedonobacter racemifer DSM 44963]
MHEASYIGASEYVIRTHQLRAPLARSRQSITSVWRSGAEMSLVFLVPMVQESQEGADNVVNSLLALIL